jgi:hypothetical protein
MYRHMYIYVMLRNMECAYVLWRQVTQKNSNNQLSNR